MRTPTSLVRSIPFWGLIAGSLAAVGGGTWIAVSHIRSMTKTLDDGTATAVDVYVGQAWVVLGAVVLGAGLVGLILTLSLSAARVLIPAGTAVVEPSDPTDPSDEDETGAEGTAEAEDAAAAEPAESAVAGVPAEGVVSR